MATVTMNYAGSTEITCAVTSLGVDGWRSSDVIDNGASNKFVDALVGGNIEVDIQTADGRIVIYAYASADAGTTYSGGLDGTTDTITWGTTHNTTINGFSQLKLLGVVDVDGGDDSVQVEFGPFSVAAAFGGVMPDMWGIVVHNDCDVIFDSVGTANTLHYMGIKYDVA